jgi:hypothetical protein
MSLTSQPDSRANGAVVTKESKRSLARVYEVDPLGDRRWQSLVERHPQASIFHHRAWLDALHRTYGYEPVVFTTSPPESDLENGLIFCRIRSWVTGHRLVSLPFSDYCEPLCDRDEEFESLIRHLQATRIGQEWKYIEVRPMKESFEDGVKKLGFNAIAKYTLHRVDLEPAAEEIFRRVDKNSVQRRVRRAERSGVVEVCGRSERLLKDFYWLMVRTRARHNLPPQPYAWFRNLLHCLGEAVELRLAYMKNVPVGAVLILHFKDTSYYKYGCSDARFHSLGVMPFLLWRALLHAKAIGSRILDLGKTEDGQSGLIEFKNHWTPLSAWLTYWTFPSEPSFTSNQDWKLRMVKRVCAYMPERLLAGAGTLIYRHIG